MNEPIQELELVLASTSTLTPAERERAALVAALKPIAERLPGYVELAVTTVVETAEQAGMAARDRDQILADADEAETALREFADRLIERLFKTHRQWTALCGAFKVPLHAAARMIKGRIIAWQTAETAKAEKERQRLQAEADERARHERERLEKEAAKLKTPELKEQRLEQAAAVIAPVVHVSVPANAVKVQRRWKAVKIDKAALIAAAATNPMLHGFLDVNETALNRSKAANSELHIPGVTFQQITL